MKPGGSEAGVVRLVRSNDIQGTHLIIICHADPSYLRRLCGLVIADEGHLRSTQKGVPTPEKDSRKEITSGTPRHHLAEINLASITIFSFTKAQLQ